MEYRFLDEHRQEFGLRWLFKKLCIHPNAYYNYLRNEKRIITLKKLIVVNGFKYFIVITRVHGAP